MRLIHYCFWVVGIFFGILAAANVCAREVKVSSLAALQSAADEATPGTRIILANGAYTATNSIRLSGKGTERQPIVIAAETIGGVEIQGSSGFSLQNPAAYVVIRGFKFTHQVGGEQIGVGANHCRYTRNIFELTGPGHYLLISGDDAEIDYNLFQNKFTVGQMITVQGPGSSNMAQRTWIHHNCFTNFPDTHQNNCSSIQIGLSSRSMAPAHSLVEHNLFIGCRGENENICNKSCQNTYRFNTFGADCSELSMRHGNRCLVYGNFFIGSEGIRIFGKDHKIYCNYFEDCRPAIHIGNGDALIPPARLTGHDRPDGVQITFNTLVSNRASVYMLRRPRGGLGATNIIFANNLIEGSGQAITLGGPVGNGIWQGNVLWGTTLGTNGLRADGFAVMDPQLKVDRNGEYRLSRGSPVRGKAVGSYPYVTVDMDGQPRGRSGLDVGADQYSWRRTTNRILTPRDVGPYSPASHSWLGL